MSVPGGRRRGADSLQLGLPWALGQGFRGSPWSFRLGAGWCLGLWGGKSLPVEEPRRLTQDTGGLARGFSKRWLLFSWRP